MNAISQSVVGTGWGATLTDLSALLFAFFVLMLATTDQVDYGALMLPSDVAQASQVPMASDAERGRLSAGYLALLLGPVFEQREEVSIHLGAGVIRIDLGAPANLPALAAPLEIALERLSDAGFDIRLRLYAPIAGGREGWETSFADAARLAGEIQALSPTTSVTPELAAAESTRMTLIAYRTQGGEWQ